MNIKNVLVIAVTLLSVTTIANAETINNNVNTSAQTEYSRAGYSGFSLGFQPSSRVIKVTKQDVNIQAEQNKIENKAKGLVLGFNGSSEASVKRNNITAKKAIHNDNVQEVNKVADSFNIGFDS